MLHSRVRGELKYFSIYPRVLSEARVTGQRAKCHFHVFLHDDVKSAHERPEGQESTCVTTRFALIIFLYQMLN